MGSAPRPWKLQFPKNALELHEYAELNAEKRECCRVLNIIDLGKPSVKNEQRVVESWNS
jgi:hypothetical protein